MSVSSVVVSDSVSSSKKGDGPYLFSPQSLESINQIKMRIYAIKAAQKYKNKGKPEFLKTITSITQIKALTRITP